MRRGSNPQVKARFDAAVRGTDAVIAGVARAYLFEGSEKPEYEYFHLIIREAGKD
jgi:hypothetical protein